MQYEIEGTPLPVVTCHLQRGETMITESGGMAWMSDGIDMETNMNGGVMKGIGRMFSGESMFLTRYTSKADGTYISFTSSFAGSIMPFKIEPSMPMIVQKSAFLASEEGVELSVHFQKKFGAGFFGGEGFIMQKLSGQGTAFVEIDGHIITKTLAPGERIKVDTGHVAAYTADVHMDIESIKGFKNVLFGGEGFFNTILTGPGTVWLQTMPVASVAKSLIPYLPKASN